MKNKFTDQELFHFCEQFSILLHSGISCAEGLSLMQEDSRTQQGKDFFQSLLNDFEENGSFATALEHSGKFPSSMISYVKIGEETGCLDEVLKSLSRHYEQELEISETIRQSNTAGFPDGNRKRYHIDGYCTCCQDQQERCGRNPYMITEKSSCNTQPQRG